jgi:uncharacterized protein (TIGR02270 family)
MPATTERALDLLCCARAMELDENDILWELESQHLEEAAFLVDVREAALDAPHYNLAELAAGPDNRLDRHLDALAVAGPVVAQRLLSPILADANASFEPVVAATLAWLRSDKTRAQELFAILDANGEPARREGIARGLALFGDSDVDAQLHRGVASASGSGLAARLHALAGRWRGSDRLAGLLASNDLEVARAAASLAREQGSPEVIAALTPLATATDDELRRVSIESALCLQIIGAWASVIDWAFAPGESPFRRAALTWVALLGDAAEHARLLARVDEPPSCADAVWALGFCGRKAAVERCMPLLDDATLGPLAAEVVCAIAGLPVDEDIYWRANHGPPDDEASALPAFEHDDLDAELPPGHEDALQIPEPEAINQWWQARADSFDPALRYLGGRPLDSEVLIDALWHAPMRRRHALALELRVRTAGAGKVDTRALVATQRSQLAALAQLAPFDGQRGFPRS